MTFWLSTLSLLDSLPMSLPQPLMHYKTFGFAYNPVLALL